MKILLVQLLAYVSNGSLADVRVMTGRFLSGARLNDAFFDLWLSYQLHSEKL